MQTLMSKINMGYLRITKFVQNTFKITPYRNVICIKNYPGYFLRFFSFPMLISHGASIVGQEVLAFSEQPASLSWW